VSSEVTMIGMRLMNLYVDTKHKLRHIKSSKKKIWN